MVDVPPSQTLVFQAENPNDMVGQGNGGVAGSEYGLYSNGTLSTKVAVHFPTTDQYDIVVKARSYPGAGASTDVRVGGPTVDTFVAATSATPVTHTSTVTVTAGDHAVQVAFTNDGSDSGGKDINLYVDSVTVIGPKSPSTGTTRADGGPRGHRPALPEDALPPSHRRRVGRRLHPARGSGDHRRRPGAAGRLERGVRGAGAAPGLPLDAAPVAAEPPPAPRTGRSSW